MDPDLIDANLVFAKTPAGEEAILQRTRVVQRNVRMVLILVDGNATVAELCDKTGNAPITRSALVDLENDGFIERRVEKDSVWLHARSSPKSLLAAAIHAVSEFSTFGDKAAAPPPVKSIPPDQQESRVIPFPESREGRSSRSPASLTPQSSVSGPPSGPALPSDQESAAPPAAADSAPARASLLDRLKAFTRTARADDQPDLKPIRRGGRRWSITWPMGLMLGVLLLSAALVLLALFFPYTNYLPEVEAALAQSTGQPAKVANMRVSLYPRPGLLLDNVRLGERPDSEPIDIAKIRLQPVLGTLLSAKILFNEAELSDLSVSAEAVASLTRMLASAAHEPARAGVLQVEVSNAEFTFAGLAVGAMSGRCELSTDRLLESISLHSPDHSLQLTLNPTARGVTVQIEGLAWQLAQGSPYRFDSLSVHGEIEGPEFVIDSVEARIFDGLVRASAVLRANQQPAMVGEMSFERINAKKLGEAIGIGGQFEGEADGKLKFAASAQTWSGMLAALHANGNFTMHRGRLGGIDLPEAVRRVSATPATLGGWTRFEELSGTIAVTPNDFRFSRLVLNAGLMQSTGQIDVSRDLQLRGRMNVLMRGQVDHSARPIVISGSLKSPLTQTASR